jgi:predicted membrane-bound spermidine synthase
MGGLAIGNAWAGRLSVRVGRPLRAYAIAEFVVAAAGISLAFALGSPAAIRLARFRFPAAFGALLVPATAMGVTLPLLVAALSRSGRNFGATLGRLYGWNTLGAVCGVVVAETVLIRRFGVMGSAWIAGAIDLAVAIVASLLTRTADAVPDDVAGRRRERPALPAAALAILAAAFLSGGILLALEVVWFRFLSLYVLTTTLAMSLMLAVVLSAIGFGGLAAASWLARRRTAVELLAAICFVSGCTAIASYRSFAWTDGAQVADWRRLLWFAIVLTGPTSLLSGMVFTLQGALLAREIGGDGRAAGWLTLANTTGATCGPLAATFVLLPLVGMERAIFFLAATYGLVALLVVPALRGARLTAFAKASAVGKPWRSVTGAALFVGAVILFPFGLMDRTFFPRSAAAYAYDGSEIVAAREGPTETIFLMQQSWLGRPVYQRLVTNGFSMSGTSIPAVRYMREFVYLPMLLRETPMRRILVVCYGVGVTAGAAADLPSAQTIDIVEISRDVAAMSDRIYRGERNPLRDPRARLHVEDGRYFLETASERWDLITGEPPPPRTPGAVNIYTREYFQSIFDHLADAGMATYWLPVGRPDPGTDVDTIARAFCDVFADCSLWNATPFDLLLVRSRGAPQPPSFDVWSQTWRRVEPGLSEIGFEHPEQMLATFAGDAPYVRALTTGTPPLTDDYPQRLRPDPARPSLSDPRYPTDPAVVARYQRVLDPGRARALFESSPAIRRRVPASLVARARPFFDEQRIVNRVLFEGGRPLRQIEDLHHLLTATDLKTLPLWVLGSDEIKQQIAEGAPMRTGETEYARGLRALASRDYMRAAAHFGEAERRGLQNGKVRALEVYALCLAGQVDAARSLARDITPRDEDERHFWTWLNRTFEFISVQ